MNPTIAPNIQSGGTPAAPLSRDVIRTLAVQVFGTETGADFWMTRPNPELGGRTPDDLIAAGHAEVVKNFLEGILEGVYG